MSEHDEDIDFDFFAEPEPEPPKRRLVRRPSGPPPGGPQPPRSAPPAAIPLIRLASAVVLAIAAILILVFAIRSCEGASAATAYQSYMEDVTPIATDSQTVGRQLNDLIANPQSQNELESTLRALIEQQNIDIEKASQLSPPGSLREQQEKLVEALQLRENALSGLLTVFRATAQDRADESSKSGRQLSAEMYKAVASDVFWSEMFVDSTQRVLREEGISGITPPASVFLAEPDIATRSSMTGTWERIHGVPSEAAAGGLHGTGITSVKVTPSNKTLTRDVTETVVVKQNLTFVVSVQNTGDYLEQNITVRITIRQPGNPITRTKKILGIYPDETKEVDFVGPFEIGTYAAEVPIKIDVTPVAGESNRDNNQAIYDVRFSY